MPPDVKSKVLEPARLTGSSSNTQHWCFILIQDKKNIRRLAEESTTGRWVGGDDFAIIVMTNPKISGYMIDACRAVQDRQLVAWDLGVGSCIFTGANKEKVRKDFGIPPELEPAAFLGFGYPARKITGKEKKNRSPLQEIALIERYGNRLSDPSRSLK
ncbi:MAG TPA: nitroreductase family protein [Nitrososphaerales archaeon]|nr:nitroreductase family protein [Nitrososphaerales archaeon]